MGAATDNYMYFAPASVLGSWGPRASANALCLAGRRQTCSRYLALACYVGSDLASLPGDFGFSADAEFTVSGDYVEYEMEYEEAVVPNWGEFVTGASLIAGGVQGCDSNGAFTGANCGDFASTAGSATASYEVYPDTHNVYTPCANAVRVPCRCVRAKRRPADARRCIA